MKTTGNIYSSVRKHTQDPSHFPAGENFLGTLRIILWLKKQKRGRERCPWAGPHRHRIVPPFPNWCAGPVHAAPLVLWASYTKAELNSLLLSIVISEPESFCFFLRNFVIYLIIFREGKGGRKRGRETSICGCLSHAPYWVPGLQPRYVPWLGIEPATIWFSGLRSIHWTTAARARTRTFT